MSKSKKMPRAIIKPHKCQTCKDYFISHWHGNKKRFCQQKKIIFCEFEGCGVPFEIICDGFFARSNPQTRYYCPYHKAYNKKRICSCGNSFVGKDNQFYCHLPIKKMCLQCNNEFEIIHTIHTDDQKFCSQQCQRDYLHKTYDMQEHNKKLWDNPAHREKVAQAMKERVISEEQRLAISKRNVFSESVLNEFNAKMQQNIDTHNKFDKWALLSYSKSLKQILKYQPFVMSLYIFSFVGKNYIKVGVTFAKKEARLKKWQKRGGSLIYKLDGDPISIIELEAKIHTNFERKWQVDFKDGKTEFHKLDDLHNILDFIKENYDE